MMMIARLDVESTDDASYFTGLLQLMLHVIEVDNGVLWQLPDEGQIEPMVAVGPARGHPDGFAVGHIENMNRSVTSSPHPSPRCSFRESILKRSPCVQDTSLLVPLQNDARCFGVVEGLSGAPAHRSTPSRR